MSIILSIEEEMEARRSGSEEILKYGTFYVQSGKLILSDPCYTPGTWCMEEVKKAMNGIWKFRVFQSNEGVFGNCINAIYAVYSEAEKVPVIQEDINNLEVDSGQFGIFDKCTYQNDNCFPEKYQPYHDFGDEETGRKFYGACCDLTLSGTQGGVVPGGAVAVSGDGDGCYNGHIFWHAGRVVGVYVRFCEPESDETDWRLY